MSYTIEAWSDGSGPSVASLPGQKTVGVGGWAVVFRLPGSVFTEEISGAEHNATSSRMEIMAVIRALEHFEHPTRFNIHCDSAYVVNAMLQGWVKNWKRNGWKTSKDKDVANRDLWERLVELVAYHIEVDFTKVKGHAKHEHNNRADKLANEAKKSVMITS